MVSIAGERTTVRYPISSWGGDRAVPFWPAGGGSEPVPFTLGNAAYGNRRQQALPKQPLRLGAAWSSPGHTGSGQASV